MTQHKIYAEDRECGSCRSCIKKKEIQHNLFPAVVRGVFDPDQLSDDREYDGCNVDDPDSGHAGCAGHADYIFVNMLMSVN